MDTTSASTARIIDSTALVSVKVGTGYYQRIQRTLFFLLNGRSKEELEEANRMVETNTCPEGSWQEQYLTILIFVKAFENEINQQKLYRETSPEELEKLLATS